MKSRFLKAACLIATTALLAGAPAQAVVLYDSTGSPRYDVIPPQPGDFPLGFNVNSFDEAATHILWDDAPIFVNNAFPFPRVEVTRLSFDFLQAAMAPGTTLEIFWTDMVDDNGENRGNNIFPFDTPVHDPHTPHLIGTIIVPANNTASPVRGIRTIGNGTDVLFTTGILNQSTPDAATENGVDFTFPLGTHPGYGYFFVGMRIASTEEDNLWVIATNPNNLFVRTEDFLDLDPSSIDEYFFGADAAGDNIAGTMSMKIEGNLIAPEPGSLALLGLAGMGLLGRRRKIA